jgi:hypothetical protein
MTRALSRDLATDSVLRWEAGFVANAARAAVPSDAIRDRRHGARPHIDRLSPVPLSERSHRGEHRERLAGGIGMIALRDRAPIHQPAGIPDGGIARRRFIGRPMSGAPRWGGGAGRVVDRPVRRPITLPVRRRRRSRGGPCCLRTGTSRPSGASGRVSTREPVANALTWERCRALPANAEV